MARPAVVCQPWLKPLEDYAVRRDLFAGSSAAGIGVMSRFG